MYVQAGVVSDKSFPANLGFGYQGPLIGGDVQVTVSVQKYSFLEVSTHAKLGMYTATGNLYGGLGPFYSREFGYGPEAIAGYRNVPRAGVGYYIEAYGKLAHTKTFLGSVMKGNIFGGSLYGLRVGIAL